ncbi:hypothetical protein CC86DRAFT_203190 [Ophiobolus disseminans]|uniref:Uncharacterized protein n=1 Tax=Ophiobolus disseminans TaxID=1469910 RepID=A0A6A7A4E5_9PLEO|nr:hypothetical protein CC86DRAFT_203190 [Ophiobolus disseminans]
MNQNLNMATSIPATGLSQSPVEAPSISICISIPISTFDLALMTPFAINVVLTLHHHHPITFRARDTRFFTNPLGKPGLEFTNIRTGETQVGMEVTMCFIGASETDILPSEENKSGWITLFQGQPYSVDASIEPIGKGRMRTLAEQRSGSEERPTSLKWPMVHRLLDGDVFEIRVNDKAGVKSWIEGPLEEILARDETPVLREEVIGFDVKETARFDVKRPDPDGSLNWL